MKYFAIPGILRCEFYQEENKKYIPNVNNILEDEVLHKENDLYVIKINPIHKLGLTVKEMQIYCPTFIGNENDKYVYLIDEEYKFINKKYPNIKGLVTNNNHIICPFCCDFCKQKCLKKEI